MNIYLDFVCEELIDFAVALEGEFVSPNKKQLPQQGSTQHKKSSLRRKDVAVNNGTSSGCAPQNRHATRFSDVSAAMNSSQEQLDDFLGKQHFYLL